MWSLFLSLTPYVLVSVCERDREGRQLCTRHFMFELSDFKIHFIAVYRPMSQHRQSTVTTIFQSFLLIIASALHLSITWDMLCHTHPNHSRWSFSCHTLVMCKLFVIFLFVCLFVPPSHCWCFGALHLLASDFTPKQSVSSYCHSIHNHIIVA